MAKRHHSSHRSHASHASMASTAGYHEREMKGETGYQSYPQSKHMMKRDSGMIHEDWNAACLLPTHVIEKQWAGAGHYMNKGIGSLFSGVQETMHEDGRAFEKSNKPRQY
jgi:hypothetical protein